MFGVCMYDLYMGVCLYKIRITCVCKVSYAIYPIQSNW